MTYIPKKLTQVQVAITSATATMYTVPAATKTILKEIFIGNETTATVTLDLHMVPSAGAMSAANRVWTSKAFTSKQIEVTPLNTVLETGEFLAAKASISACLTLRASGIEVT